MSNNNNKLGFSGVIAGQALRSQLTPLLALFAFGLGIFAALMTPREEEPQIDVTMANVFVPFPGASVDDVVALVTAPMEQVLAEIQDVEHIYSASRPGMSVLTVQFEVGVPRTEALVRLYNAVHSNNDWRPSNLGVGQVLIKPKGIDDVPIVAATLWTRDSQRGALELAQIAHSLETELKRVSGTRDIDTLGAVQPTLRLLLAPERLAAHDIDIADLRRALLAFNTVTHSGDIIADNRVVTVQAGEYFSRPEQLRDLVVGIYNNRPVYLQAVADIEFGAPENTHYVWHANAGDKQTYAAVTLQISKKPGENAVEVAAQVIDRIESLRGIVIPSDVEVNITRDYGSTANDKANKLIQKLIFASLSVIVLVIATMGMREAVVVGVAVILTLAVTLFASWAYGFTLNRVSLFALIFSIGILVDDAIVVVENIHRHLALSAQSGDKKNIFDVIPAAVAEVGGPTVLATFTVIAALLPMAFVTGLMGPYMNPIPINASMGMFISLVVAFTVTPWLSGRLLGKHVHVDDTKKEKLHTEESGVQKIFSRLMTPFLGDAKRRNRYGLVGGMVLLIVGALMLVNFKLVVMKMLPFDNKSEFKVVVDLPEGSSLEHSNAVLAAMADYLLSVEEVVNLQVYAGVASPIGFNGLVRQYYLRAGPNLGDIQVNLVDKHHRDRNSHDIARSVRPALVEIAQQYQAAVKVVEVPPGPPVQAPLVAEVYGPNYQGQLDMGRQLQQRFVDTPDVVDVDSSIENGAEKWILEVDRARAAQLGVAQQQISDAIAVALGGENVTYLYDGRAKYPIPIRLQLPPARKSDIDDVLQLKVRAVNGELIPISVFTAAQKDVRAQTVYHKDLLPVVYVTGDMAGDLDSPLYGMFDLVSQLDDSVEQFFVQQPSTPFAYSVKWDGEWQITYETFRDMGAAYSVGLLLIYLLVVSQFRSYLVPLIIMTPIPLTLIGIMPGHALLGAQFTATSMIGMMALAGILVRNSILLVDFINRALQQGEKLERAIVAAAAVRAKPIF